ncbi:hypothetical protein N7495_007042 [Penicillium taxi]|uniref:uncharacterized protein n=1 Tax=Penicillium taxi TaxID=168475 RepID=UPI00254595D3|nr:uncharacterized protein N7495_007042 [Penicillium taxi]KAJ5895351.1 hypothetical protein N7495_007042 [Penicillium taxi]
MKAWKSLVVVAFAHRALCSEGDICYVVGAKTSLVEDRLYFMGGNYSVISYDGQVIEPAASLYSIGLNSQFPVERSIPQAVLNNHTITSKKSVAYENALRTSGGDANGAIWSIDDSIYVFGGGFKTPNDKLSVYNVSTDKWKDVTVAGGNFNFGNRTSVQFASAPDSGLGFIYGGSAPYMSGMIRFNATDPDNLSWTNETLGNGSYGTQVPNLNAGAMVYIPAGKEGMLISFGGGNITAGISPYSGWPYEADWLIIYVYDIATHTWWMQEASGSPPSNRDSFCTAVTASPDGGAFHITTYGGWSLGDQRSYEDVNILTIPSFTWINATKLSNKSNKEQQINSTIGRDALNGACQTYQGSQMIVLGGEIRADAYSLTNGACSNVFEPVRVLDLSTYKWQTELSTNLSYEVPAVIFNEIGGNKNGSATVTAPAAGFADATLASLIQQRVATPTNTGTNTALSTPSNTASTQDQDKKSNHINSGAIAGGVVGGVAGLAIIAGIAWLLIKRSRAHKSLAKDPQSGSDRSSPHSEIYELDAAHPFEAPTDGEILEISGEGTTELPGAQGLAELGGHEKDIKQTSTGHLPL